MAKVYRFYLVEEDGTVSGTDNFEVAVAAKQDGSTTVIEPSQALATFDGDEQTIEESDAEAFLGEDFDEDEGADEEDAS